MLARTIFIANAGLTCDEVLAVGVLFKRLQVWLEFGNEDITLLAVHDIQHLLDHIVGKLVLHHQHQGRRAIGSDGNHFFDKSLAISLGSVGDTLFDHVAGKLVLAQHQNLSHHLGDHKRLFDWFSALEDVLDHIVAVLVLHEVGDIAMEFIQEGLLFPIHKEDKLLAII